MRAYQESGRASFSSFRGDDACLALRLARAPAARRPAFHDPKNFSTMAALGRVWIAFDQSSRTGVRPRLDASRRKAASSRSANGSKLRTHA